MRVVEDKAAQRNQNPAFDSAHYLKDQSESNAVTGKILWLNGNDYLDCKYRLPFKE
jgi:hypothetical protein